MAYSGFTLADTPETDLPSGLATVRSFDRKTSYLRAAASAWANFARVSFAYPSIFVTAMACL